MVKDMKFKHGKFDDENTLVLSNEKLSYSPLYDRVLEDVKVVFLDDGYAHITAKEVEYNCNWRGNAEYDYNLKDVQDDDIIIKKTFFTRSLKAVIKDSWFRMKKRLNFEVISRTMVFEIKTP